MNTGFYENLDKNFEQALEMSQREFSHDELIELLKNGNLPQKQIAAMRIEDVNEEEADILINNLTGCDGKIREAVALKINQLLLSDKKYITTFSKYYLPLANGTIDINGNICRMVIESVKILKTDNHFGSNYIKKILLFIDETFKALDKIIYRDKKYTVNKQLFKLYWCLESLSLFTDQIDNEILYPIIKRCSEEKEYTIREKAAQIIAKINDGSFLPLKEKLQNDENYYVRAALK